MGILTINDCGTAHETQLLDIYKGLIDKEKIATGKEPTSLEKSKIEEQVAEAYQSILTICNDGGQISKALDLLKERVPTMSINEISKAAVEVVSQVSNVRGTEQNNSGNIGDIVAATAIGHALSDDDGKQNDSILSEKYHGVDDNMFTEVDVDPEMAEEFRETIGEIKKVFEVEDGSKIIFVDPIDEKYKIPESEADEVEEEISLKQRQTEILDEKLVNAIEFDIDKAIEEYEKDLVGLGIDAKLRFEYNKLVCNGVIQLLAEDTPYNKYRRETFFALLDSIKKENALENGFEEDSYVLATKLGIFSRVLNDPQMSIQGPMQDELRTRLRDTDPELYALLERDPLILEKMQTTGRTTEPMDAMIEIIGTSDPIGREEFFQTINELSKSVDRSAIKDSEFTNDFKGYEESHKDYLLNRKGERPKYVMGKYLAEREEARAKMSPSTRKQVKKEAIERLIKKAGIGKAINVYFTLKMIEADKGETIDAINEFFDFAAVGENGNYVDQITGIDIEMMKDQLQVLIENQNEKLTPYICTLGDIITKATEREKTKLLSTESISTEDIVKQYGDSEKIARNKDATISENLPDVLQENNSDEHDDR